MLTIFTTLKYFVQYVTLTAQIQLHGIQSSGYILFNYHILWQTMV